MALDLLAYFGAARSAVSVQAGIVLFSEGEPGKNLFVIIEGEVSVLVGGRVVEVAGPGSVVGEMAMVDSSARSATVVTRTVCRVISIDKKQFDALLREFPQFGRHVMTVMADRLRRMNDLMAKRLQPPVRR